MEVQLFVKYEDIKKYNNGEEIFATDLQGKGAIFKVGDNILQVNIPSNEIIYREDVVTTGFVSGIFNKYIIKKLTSTCCNKNISVDEAILNHGMCNKCMDKGSE